MATVAQQFLGNRRRFEVSIDGGATFLNVGGLTSVGLSVTGSEADASTFDTPRYKEFLNDLVEAEYSLGGNLVHNDPGLAAMLAANHVGVTVIVRDYVRKLAASGIRYTQWTGNVRDRGEDAAMGSAQTYSFAVRVFEPTILYQN